MMNKNLETIKKHPIQTLLVTLIALTFVFSTPIGNFLGEALGPVLSKEIKYNTQCGQEPPLLVKIPDLTEGQIFSCDFKIKKKAKYEISLQYPYTNQAERQEIWDLHDGRAYTNKEGNPVDSSAGSISFSIFQDKKEIFGKKNITPKIGSYGHGYLNTKIKTLPLTNIDATMNVTVSGIPKKNYSYHGIYLLVRERVH